MEDRTVGLLDPVDPATAWNSEPGDFVPWLLQPHNLGRLGDALGLDLEPVAREAPVGRFRADIVCRDRHTAGAVVIEAQLGTSDHSHLGHRPPRRRRTRPGRGRRTARRRAPARSGAAG